jgi:2,3-bisphosphoglycerate-independent phosphoglycerate mutase
MKYEGIKPSSIAFPPLVHENVLGKIIEENNLKQLRIAETEKYAHVTFFFDGGEEINFKNEEKILVASPKVLTYDEKPEMSALEITEKLIAKMPTEDVIICNFANGDMVGHTGNFDATIKAIEFIDEMVGKIFEAAKKNNFTLFITADHGNADKLIDDNNNIVTSHTTAPVPFIITDENVKITKNKNNKLANIAPSLLQYLGIEIPKEMANSIIKN